MQCINRSGCSRTDASGHGCGLSGCQDLRESAFAESRRFVEISALPDTLSICDDEIKAIFEGKSYDVGLPIQAQLAKEIRLLRTSDKRIAALEMQNTELLDTINKLVKELKAIAHDS
jgi:hypothetical protein